MALDASPGKWVRTGSVGGGVACVGWLAVPGVCLPGTRRPASRVPAPPPGGRGLRVRPEPEWAGLITPVAGDPLGGPAFVLSRSEPCKTTSPLPSSSHERDPCSDHTPRVPQIFALIVFACIFGEGYSNRHRSEETTYCVFNRNEDACRYGGAIGVLAFLACAFFFVVDVYFPQISNATDRKYLVVGDLLFSALWTFLWFVGFCFLTNQWAATNPKDVLVGADSPRAAIAFSFFSIFSWGTLALLAYQRYKAGVDDFLQNYVDPTPDPATVYASYPAASADDYQQPPFTQNAEASPDGYQPPPVY
ncbi:synaptogyrin-2 [Echinops telfairi]|uniref:Synaptogyrin-2 n=1 Tax=Echinops telfairi TaxID=9371 RepID=A0AC55DUP2_ECHTE|nr:synaptogyrin-2 [Echinops telfairi]